MWIADQKPGGGDRDLWNEGERSSADRNPSPKCSSIVLDVEFVGYSPVYNVIVTIFSLCDVAVVFVHIFRTD